MTFTKEQLQQIIRVSESFLAEEAATGGKGDLQLWLDEVCPETTLHLARELLESRADAELAEIDERAVFNAWNNDTECPLAGRDAKSAAWLAWSRRAALLAAAPKQEAQEVKK
ncbi:hypothetical protein [Atlantibacter hermannii]|uniref:hypothetical protein n=1 Tax=Atlantibacter hermannii TaxID=565 RepID=UPI0028ACCBDC|nr:hypothetical protein [Atlantibacter hermannii]